MNTTWQTEYLCVYCEHVLSYSEKMDSHGRCPYCGEKHPNAVTIVETKERAIRYVKNGENWTKEIKGAPTNNTQNNMSYSIAQLRHLYQQMVSGEVKDTKQAAEGLLEPVIEKLEEINDKLNTQDHP